MATLPGGRRPPRRPGRRRRPRRSTSAAPPGPGPAPGGRRRSPCPPGRPARRPAAARPRRSPLATPPTPTMGRSGCAARTSKTARTATGMDGRAGQPAPSRRRAPDGRVDASSTMPEQGVDERDGLGPAVAGRGRDLGELGDVVGLSLAHRGRRQAAVAAIAARVAAGEWANMCRRSSRLGQERLTSTATTSARRVGEQVGRGPVLLDRPAPDAGHDPGPGRAGAAAGRRAARPRRRGPGARRR